jgi:hypothetical protein
MSDKRREPYNPLLKSYPDSEKVNAVSIGAETLFTRLIAASDDYAHFYGDPKMITAKLFTRRMIAGQVSARKIGGWLNELVRVGLVKTYEVDQKKYLAVVNCRKALRRDVQPDVHFPTPDEATESNTFGGKSQNPRDDDVTDAGRGRNGDGTLTQPNHPQPNYPTRAKRARNGDGTLSPGAQRFWDACPPKARERSSRKEVAAVWKKLNLEPETDTVLAGLEACKQSEQWTKEGGKYIPGAHRFLDKEKFRDPPAPATSTDSANGDEWAEQRDLTEEEAAELYPERRAQP